MKKVIYCSFIIILVGIMLISIIFINKDISEDKKQQEIFEELINIVVESKDEDITNIDKDEYIEAINNTGDEIIRTSDSKDDYSKLFEMNTDMVAWIKIDGTNINYPIMQTRDKPNYYLNRNFYKQYSVWGTPYIQENCNTETSDNLIIYGHHIQNSKMFGELEKYKRKQYYENHKIIQFITKEGNYRYEVIAVFQTDADTGFKYYDFVKIQNRDEFDTFIKECKELSFYDTEQTSKYGDKLITLSTCEYSSPNGRLVVVAKQV